MSIATSKSASAHRPGTFAAAGSAKPKGARSQWRIYDELRERIVRLDIAPDTALSRVELAADFEVSQTPVREALQLLEQDGLVRIQPQSKTVVTRLDTSQLQEAHFLRVALEVEVVRELARRNARSVLVSADETGNRHDSAVQRSDGGTTDVTSTERLTGADKPPLDAGEDIVARLRSLVKLQSALAGNIKEMTLFDELDQAFHRTLFEAAGHPGLHELVRSRSGHMARARRLDLPMKGKMLNIVEAHTAIVDAIEQGDPAAADGAMRRHLSGTIARISKLQQEFPDYFN